jgi:two-component system nitrate/nitrite response regulator NarL
MSDPMTLVLGDDHTVFLDALASVLSQLGHLVKAAVTTRSSLVYSVRSLRPDVCVTGSQFADGPVIEVLDQLGADCPDTKIMMLTADGNPDTLRRALNAGAVGYVHKTRGVSVLVEALRRVTKGELVIEGSFSGPRPNGDEAPMEVRRLAAYLTPREAECLALLVEGLDTTAMAIRFGISPTTVRSHVQALLTKLGVHSRLEAASMAIRHGLVSMSTTAVALDPAATGGCAPTISPKLGRRNTVRRG